MRNRFSGKCLKCGKFVPVGKGHPERKQGKWYIRCLNCVNSAEKPIIIIIDDFELYDKLEGIK